MLTILSNFFFFFSFLNKFYSIDHIEGWVVAEDTETGNKTFLL